MDMQYNSGAVVEIDIGGWLGDIFKHLSTRWNQYLKPFGMVFVGVFAAAILLGCTGAIGGMIAGQLGEIGGLLMAAVMGLMGIVIGCAFAPVALGMCRGTQAALRGQDFTMEHITGAFGDFLPALGTLVLLYLAVFIGSVFCVIPGLIAAVLLSLALPVLADRGGSPIDALKTSVDIVKPNAVMYFVMLLVLGLVNFALNIIPLVGALVGALMQLVAINYMYLRLTGQAGGMGEDGVVRA